jgi:hypothetical protein
VIIAASVVHVTAAWLAVDMKMSDALIQISIIKRSLYVSTLSGDLRKLQGAGIKRSALLRTLGTDQDARVPLQVSPLGLRVWEMYGGANVGCVSSVVTLMELIAVRCFALQ